jgi:chaperonin GroES
MMETMEHGMGGMQGQVIPFPVYMPSPEEIAQFQSVMELRKRLVMLQRMADMPNAAEILEDGELGNIGSQVTREYNIDKSSRDDWEKRARRAMDLARQKKDQKSWPWDGASNVKFPMLTTAALQFAARAYPAICDGPMIVKTQVLGDDPKGLKAEAAGHVACHMSYQLLYEVEDWEADVDTMLHQLPIVGCAFKKVYPDKAKAAGFCDDLISAFDLVVNQRAKSLDTVPRITHVFPLYPYEIKERQRAGTFRDVELSGSKADSNDDDEPQTFLEQHRYLDLDGDGVPEPWIVTVHEQSSTVVRIVAAFDAEKIDADMERGRIIRIPRRDYFVKFDFLPDPEGGFYGVGFGHLLEPLSDVIDTMINQMTDAGTLQNAGGGFIASGVDLGKGKSEISLAPGKYRTIQTAAQDLRQGIYSIDHPGPSKVLFDLLSLMIDSGKDVAAIQDILVGDMPRNQTATTTMAMIEQGLKVFTAIYKRLYRSLKKEFRMIFEINKANLDMPKYVALLDEPVQVVQNDYYGEMDIMPVADPNTVTDMQRLQKASLIMEEAKGGNKHVDLYQATKRLFEAARIYKPEEVLIPPSEGPSPQEQVALEGMIAELEEVKARVEKLRAETDKIAADAALARARIGLPPGVQIPIAQPQFMPGALAQMPQEQPASQQMPGPMGDMPPEMMGGAPQMMPDMSGAQMMPDAQGLEGIPPELTAQIADEQMSASDAMPGDGMPF